MSAMIPTNAISLDILLQQHAKAELKFSVDSRELMPGDIFMAYPVGRGSQVTDNRAYIPEALEKNVALVIYEPEGLDEQLKTIIQSPRCVPIQGLANRAGEIVSKYLSQPSATMNITGVTGTNGKTTITQWLAQAYASRHGQNRAAVIGTLGVGRVGQEVKTGYTTPDATKLQHLLHDLNQTGVQHLAMEVSSHALDQARISGTFFDKAVFTNLTQDHLDYHGSLESYANAKAKIFGLKNLKTVVLNGDDAQARQWLKNIDGLLADTVHAIYIYGLTDNVSVHTAKEVNSVAAKQVRFDGLGMSFDVLINQKSQGTLRTRFIGEFNVSNALAVVCCLLADQWSFDEIRKVVEELQPVRGRLEIVHGADAHSPLAVVDYAHTPDALEKALSALQPLAKERGGKLWCVFGCGGNRDATKRPVMGAIAYALADQVMVTSDNPRDENPQEIIDQILAGIQNPTQVSVNADRATAILQVVRQANQRDVVLVAGKGHEDTQEIAGKKLPFSDQLHLQLAMRGGAL